MGALLALIPVKDWFYGAIFATLAVMGWHFYDKYETAVNYATTVKAESKQALATAQQTIKDNDAAHAATVAAMETQHANDIAAALVQHNADLSRLRAAAPGQGRTVLGGAAAPGESGIAGADGYTGMGNLPGHTVVCEGLADALRADDDILADERAERDSLTGK